MRRCAATKQIAGTEKLVLDGHGSIQKFGNLLAELKFALAFAAVGGHVQLLRDGAFAPALYTPDMLVTFPDGFELLVDAVHVAHGYVPLADALRSAMEARELPYAIEPCAGPRLSIPWFDVKTHTAAKALCAQVANIVTDTLQASAPRVSGIVRVSDSGSGLVCEVELGTDARDKLYDDALGNTGQQWLGTFGFAPSARAAAGGGVTAAHFIDEETLGAKFIERVVTKALKRASLPPERANTPFIVALDNNEPELRPANVLWKLTGSRVWASSVEQPPHDPRIEAARSRGWDRLLKEWRYIGASQVRIPNHGAFGDESVTWANDVSGVLVLHDSDTLLQWLPNPFADAAIASHRLLDIGFSFDMLGASNPDVSI